MNLVQKVKKFVKNNKTFIAASTFLLAAGVADCYTTTHIISTYNLLQLERNPFGRYLIENFGLNSLYYAKLAGSSIVIRCAHLLNKDEGILKKIKNKGSWAIFFGGAIYAGLAIHNGDVFLNLSPVSSLYF